MPADESIFLVGPSRSGNTLMQHLLNRTNSVFVLHETRYFDEIRPQLTNNSIRNKHLFDSIQFNCKFNTCAQYSESSSFRANDLLLESLESCDLFFAKSCQKTAESNNASRWGDKTPRNIYQIATILDSFPNAKVICMVRDPRSVIASYKQWPISLTGRLQCADRANRFSLKYEIKRLRASYDPWLLSFMWRSAVRAAADAQRDFGCERIQIVHFEDFLKHYPNSFHKLLNWLSIEGQSTSLEEIGVLNSSFQSSKAAAALSRSSTELEWPRVLTHSEIAVIQFVCHKEMHDLNYNMIAIRFALSKLFYASFKFPVAAARAIYWNRKRMGRITLFLSSRLGIRQLNRKASKTRGRRGKLHA